MNLKNTVTNSYSEESSSFDPPSNNNKRKRREEADDDNNKSERTYDDALLLASLSDDVDDRENEGRADVGGSSGADASVKAEDAPSTDAPSKTPDAATPRRSNATTSITLHPKPSAKPTCTLEASPELQQQHGTADKKKVTPEREVKHHQPVEHRMPHPDPYHRHYPPPHYPYYQYPPYYHAQPRYPDAANATKQRDSDSPLPYHPLSHVVPRHEMDHPAGPPNAAAHYPPHPASWDHHLRAGPPPPAYAYPYPPPGSYPPHAAHHHPYTAPPPPPHHHSAQLNSSSSSTSPPRSVVKPWVSMDENSPRVEYPPGGPSYPPRYDYASAVPPGTPSHAPTTAAHSTSTPSHASHVPPTPSSQHAPYYDYREYSTPPPPPSGGAAAYEWENHHAMPPPPTGHSNSMMPHHAIHPVHPHASDEKSHQFRKGSRGMHSEPVILRKKFSWRNYPELEEYLIANRTEYLHHSALNYTAEQKHFNNRLTEGLLELAAKHNYIFDESCFNFVAVRDRIRCYYKSYVQSSKKRGIIVGFPKVDGGRKKAKIEAEEDGDEAS